MALQRTRRPRLRSARSLRSLGSPLNARPLGRPVLARVIDTPLILSVLTSALAVGGCRGDHGGWYRAVSVDPSSVQLKMIDRLESQPLKHESAFRDELTEKGRVVEQVGPEGPDGRRPRQDFFFADRGYRVLYRQKDHELLHGSFGSIYAITRYWYDERYRGQPTAFTVEGYSKRIGSQRPTVVDALPSGAVENIVAMSLVRVLRAHPEYAVFSATYSPDGQVRWLDVSAARNGDWASAAELVGGSPPINGGGFGGVGLKIPAWYGVPTRFPIQTYLSDRKPFWPAASFSEELTAVHLHYDNDQWVRQDVFAEGKMTSRVLHFEETPQDRILAIVDQKRGFGTWSSASWE